MRFHQAFFEELEKAAGMKHYPDPKDDEADERHWDMRRNWSTAAGAFGALPAAFIARKGRKLRTLGGAILGTALGGAATGPLGAAAGGAIGARLAHGARDRTTSVREMQKYKNKK